MQSIALQLETVIAQYLPALKDVPESGMLYKPSPSKWSKKEIVGHLIDSAQNNIRRFIVAQYEVNPAIIYILVVLRYSLIALGYDSRVEWR